MGPKRKGFDVYYSLGFLPFSTSIYFFNLLFSSSTFWIFWFKMVLLEDFKIDRSLTLFLNWVICSSNEFVIYLYLTISFSIYLFFSTVFFLNASYSLSLSWRFWIWVWFLTIFYAFLSRWSLEFISNYCRSLSHSFFFSSKFYLTYWH